MAKAKSALRRAAALLAALCLAASMTLPVYAEGAEAADTTAIAVQDDTIETPTPEGNTTEPQDAEATPTPEPTAEPTAEPTPTPELTAEPTAEPTITPALTAEPTAEPTITPKPTHTPEPTVTPTPDEDAADDADEVETDDNIDNTNDIAVCAESGKSYNVYFAPPSDWGAPNTVKVRVLRKHGETAEPTQIMTKTDRNTTDGRPIYTTEILYNRDDPNAFCSDGGFVWIHFERGDNRWVGMKGSGSNNRITLDSIIDKCFDAAGASTGEMNWEETKWKDLSVISVPYKKYADQQIRFCNNSEANLAQVTAQFYIKDKNGKLQTVGDSITVGLVKAGETSAVTITIPDEPCAYIGFTADGKPLGKTYYNFYGENETDNTIGSFTYSSTNSCFIYDGTDNPTWGVPGTPPGYMRIYFDASLSHLAYTAVDEIDAGQKSQLTTKYGMPGDGPDQQLHCWIATDASGMGGEQLPLFKDTTATTASSRELWYVDIPEGYKYINFAAGKVTSLDASGNGTMTGKLEIPSNLKEEPCFFADSSDDVIYKQNQPRGGYWGKKDSVRNAAEGKKGTPVVDITPHPFQNIPGIKYISSTLYDYYTDYELNGNNRDNYDKMSHDESFKQQRNWVTFRQFDRTVSDYYSAAAETEKNKPNYPIYTGHFQPDEAGDWPLFRNLADTLDLYGWDYKGSNGNVAYRKFMATNNSKLDAQPNGTTFGKSDGKYNYTMLGLAANQLSGGTASGNLLMSGTTDLLEPHFNEAFLKGGNSRNAKIGEVYHNVLFPFTKNNNVFTDQPGVDYWWFDSSQTSLYMRQDPKTEGYYLGNKSTDGGKTSANCTDEHSQNLNAISGTYGVSTTYGFFPFNEFNETTPVRSVEKYNYGFGARLEIPFSLTADGQVQDENGKSKPIRFYFSGDDDVWVYIDGQLALDIGGAHGKVSGILDFGSAANDTVTAYVSRVKSNGTSSSYGDMNDDANKTSELKIQYVGDGKDTDYYYSTPVNIPNLTTGTHTLTMFYMERGMWESNMAVAYNFPDYNELQVEKEVKVDKVDKDFQKFFTDDSLRLFSVDILNQATHFPKKDSTTAPAAQTVTDFTSYHMKTKTNGDNNYLRREAPPEQDTEENKTTVHWHATEDDRSGTIDGKPCSNYRYSRYGEIALANALDISNMDTLTFQVYAPSENKFNSNEKADPVSVEYLYLELVDESDKVVGCTGGELEDKVPVNTYLKDKVQGNASIPDSTWSMLKIDLTKWDTARLQNVKYIRVGYDYARNIYFRNFTFSRSVVTTKAGFTTKQYDIPDYGTADSGKLAIPVGAQYTSNKGDGGKTYAIGEDGQFDLANGEIVSFKDQFRRGSYISLREDTAGSLFDTRWEIYENDRLVQDMGTGDTVNNNVNGKEAPKPLCKDNDVAPDDSRAEAYMTGQVDGEEQANKGYTTTQKPKDTNTIVFRSYTNPDETDQFTKLRVRFINTVKVGSLSIKKSEPEGESYLANQGQPFSFTIVFDNIGGLGLGGVKPVVKQVQVGVGQTVKLDGIPVGTHFTITEDAKPGSFLKGAKLNDSVVNGSVVEGTIAAGDTVAEFTNTARELFDITLDKQWLNANGEPLAHDGLPDSVWVQLQRREGDSSEWKAVKTVELRHSGQTDTWKTTITALDKYADPADKTTLYTYRVVEYSVDKNGNKTLDNGSGVLLGDYKYDPRYTYTSTQGVTLPNGITGGGSITITNKRQKPKYKLDITKQGIDGENEPVLLSGVEFTLEVKGTNGLYTAVTDSPQTTDENGKCSFTGLEPGSYRLTEVKTADSYTLLAEPIEFVLTDKGKCTHDNAEFGTVKRDAESGVYTIALTINNRKGLTLPHTGADAPSLWVLIGLPLLVAGLLVLVFRYNRKGGKRS